MIKKIKIFELINAIHEKTQPDRVIYGSDVYTWNGADYKCINMRLFYQMFNNEHAIDAVETEVEAIWGVNEWDYGI